MQISKCVIAYFSNKSISISTNILKGRNFYTFLYKVISNSITITDVNQVCAWFVEILTYKKLGVCRNCLPPKSCGYLNIRKKQRWPTKIPSSSYQPLNSTDRYLRDYPPPLNATKTFNLWSNICRKTSPPYSQYKSNSLQKEEVNAACR